MKPGRQMTSEADGGRCVSKASSRDCSRNCSCLSSAYAPTSPDATDVATAAPQRAPGAAKVGGADALPAAGGAATAELLFPACTALQDPHLQALTQQGRHAGFVAASCTKSSSVKHAQAISLAGHSHTSHMEAVRQHQQLPA